MGMAEVMLGKELHPDRVIQVEKLYEIFNKYGIPYSFAAQHGIENNAFAVVRCRDCKYSYCNKYCTNEQWKDDGCATVTIEADDFCSYGELKEGAY